MALDFKECFEKFIKIKGELPNELYPLEEFEKLDKVARNGILKEAENKFNYSHRTYADFYGYLFQQLHEAGVSKVDGTEAYGMYIVYKNAMQVFPQFENLTLAEQMKLLKETHKRAKSNERNLTGCAMNLYLILVENNLDVKTWFKDEVIEKGSTDSPWRAASGKTAEWRQYEKKFQNFKQLKEYDTGKVFNRKYPVWTSYTPKDNFHGISRTFMSVDIWTMLTK